MNIHCYIWTIKSICIILLMYLLSLDLLLLTVLSYYHLVIMVVLFYSIFFLKSLSAIQQALIIRNNETNARMLIPHIYLCWITRCDNKVQYRSSLPFNGDRFVYYTSIEFSLSVCSSVSEWLIIQSQQQDQFHYNTENLNLSLLKLIVGNKHI